MAPTQNPRAAQFLKQRSEMTVDSACPDDECGHPWSVHQIVSEPPTDPNSEGTQTYVACMPCLVSMKKQQKACAV